MGETPVTDRGGSRRQAELLDPNAGLMPKKGEREGTKIRLKEFQTITQF